LLCGELGNRLFDQSQEAGVACPGFEPNSGQFKRAMIAHKWRLLVNYADVA
jgi:hypothetical protein